MSQEKKALTVDRPFVGADVGCDVGLDVGCVVGCVTGLGLGLGMLCQLDSAMFPHSSSYTRIFFKSVAKKRTVVSSETETIPSNCLFSSSSSS